ncbi:DNA-binding transcriptional LysR family regulator [Palleronia aestuarii]|uniref:DNA-binding transcriptional LysR family regulator n=1 Tax=Palleronia aestuarii TaxID=568105 RepID=A0A2W7NNR7_9RHOB|nr:LysR substrate-binding domain-containing protein [Palleronia aestuarii]PZX14876.1 DNA-binding transcriptional LysR family regulator [Palleronia aestuarii]
MDMNTGIDLRQLRYFVCLADELHFGRAAERLGIRQAPLSQQIKLLEDRLGTMLFHRTTRRTRLTPAGETMLRHARELLDGMDRAIAHTRAMASESTGRLTVAGVQVALSHVLPPILEAFRQSWPAVIIDVRHLGTGDQLRTLEAGEINIALIRPTGQAPFMQTRRLVSEPLLAALPRTHRLADRAELRLSDFEGEDMVGYADVLGAPYSGVVAEAFRRAGVHPRVVQKCTHTMTIATHVASGLGLAIVPSWISNMRSPRLVFRPMPELDQGIDLLIAWPSGETAPVILDFVQTAERVCAEIAPEIGMVSVARAKSGRGG